MASTSTQDMTLGHSSSSTVRDDLLHAQPHLVVVVGHQLRATARRKSAMSACLVRRPYQQHVYLLLARQARSSCECLAYGRNKGCKEKLGLD